MADGIAVTISAEDAAYRRAMLGAAQTAERTAGAIQRSMGDLTKSVSASATTQVAQLERLNATLLQTKMAAAGAGQAVGGFAGGGFGMGGGLGGIATQMAGFAAIMGTIALGGSALKAMGDFERQVALLGAVSESTSAQIEPLRDQAIALGASTSRSATDVAALQVELAKLGWGLDRIKASTSGILNLSIAGDSGAGEAAQLVGSMIMQYKLGAEESQRIADLLAQAAIKSAADVKDFATSMDYAGGIAAQYGWQLEETLSALMALSNAGFNPSMGATGLRSLIFDFARPTAHAKEFFRLIKFEALDARGKLKPLAQLVDEFNKALGKRGLSVNTMPFGIIDSNSSAALAAIMQQGTKALGENRAELEKSAGAADRLAQVYTTGLQGALERLKGAWDSFSIALGDTGALAAMTNAVDGLAKSLDGAGKFLKEHFRDTPDYGASSDAAMMRRRAPKGFDPSAPINVAQPKAGWEAWQEMGGGLLTQARRREEKEKTEADKAAAAAKAKAQQDALAMRSSPLFQQAQQMRRLRDLADAARDGAAAYTLLARAHGEQDAALSAGKIISIETAKLRAQEKLDLERLTELNFRLAEAAEARVIVQDEMARAQTAARADFAEQIAALEAEAEAAKKGAQAYREFIALRDVRAADSSLIDDPDEAERRAKALDKAREANNKAIDGLERMKQAGREAADAIASGFERAILQGGKLKDVMRGIAQDLLSIFVRKSITEPFARGLEGIFSGKKGGAGGGGGGLVAGEGSGGWLSKLLGGVGSVLKGGFGGFFANGGDPPLGKFSIVGERGPEIIVPRVPSTVIPNHVARAMMGGAANDAAPSATVNLHIDARGADAGVEMRLRVIAEEVAARSQQATLKALAQAQRARTSF